MKIAADLKLGPTVSTLEKNSRVSICSVNNSRFDTGNRLSMGLDDDEELEVYLRKYHPDNVNENYLCRENMAKPSTSGDVICIIDHVVHAN